MSIILPEFEFPVEVREIPTGILPRFSLPTKDTSQVTLRPTEFYVTGKTPDEIRAKLIDHIKMVHAHEPADQDNKVVVAHRGLNPLPSPTSMRIIVSVTLLSSNAVLEL